MGFRDRLPGLGQAADAVLTGDVPGVGADTARRCGPDVVGSVHAVPTAVLWPIDRAVLDAISQPAVRRWPCAERARAVETGIRAFTRRVR